MKRIILAVALIGTAAQAQYAHEVRGYTRSDGTYVAPHVQTNSDGNAFNNYSSRPNVNPYTGQQGTVDPYAAQAREHSRGSSASPYGGNPY